MGIRIQPRLLEISTEDPFKHDRLEREEPIKLLTAYLGLIESGGVLAIDAPWGTGKTTFLEMWAAYLRSQDFTVVKFNAWETDFFGEPFVALSSEVTHELESLSERAPDLKELTQSIVRFLSNPFFKLGLSMIPYVGSTAVQVIDPLTASQAEQPLSDYETAKEAISKFRVTLSDVAKQLAESAGGKPIVVVIDELDRCRPPYAIELLEVAKHLFGVDHVVFVLALHRAQLARSIKAVYGDEFESEEYLRRFFDVDYRLPEPDRGNFIQSLIEDTQVSASSQSLGVPAIAQMVRGFFRHSGLSLRTIEQAIHRLGLIIAATSRERSHNSITMTALLILRTLDEPLYIRFINGATNGYEVIDGIFFSLRRCGAAKYAAGMVYGGYSHSWNYGKRE